MIISHKHKFLFIGLPFSASSAITKELYHKYNGEPLLRKHSLYNEFKKIASEEELDYFVFAVLRNPMEIVVTAYEKMKQNKKGNFTNPILFQKNGGHITNRQLERFKFIQKSNASFQDYFKKYFNAPYDNLASLTLESCDFIIRYEKIEKDYITALQKAGIKNPKKLPVANKTEGKNQNLSEYYTKEIKNQAISVFGPFLKKYNYDFPENWGKVRVPLKSIILFNILAFFRRLFYPYKKQIKRKSISGSIYGDIQRERKG